MGKRSTKFCRGGERKRISDKSETKHLSFKGKRSTDQRVRGEQDEERKERRLGGQGIGKRQFGERQGRIQTRGKIY